MEWTTPGGLTVSRPLEMVTRLDFSRGKVIYLSDLEPESVEFEPYFGTPEAAAVLAEFRGPRMDTNLSSGPPNRFRAL